MPKFTPSRKVEKIWHPYTMWECIKGGFFDKWTGEVKSEGEEIYKQYLSDLNQFEIGLRKVITEWKYSCEHNLTNEGINRIAWLGQASVCIAKGVPSCCRSGFYRLDYTLQEEANALAHVYLNRWLKINNYKSCPLEFALKGRTRLNSFRKSCKTTRSRLEEYLKVWKKRGYSTGIPDEVPRDLYGKVPSYRQIAECILKNDVQFTELGFPSKKSVYYSVLKGIEIKVRNESI